MEKMVTADKNEPTSVEEKNIGRITYTLRIPMDLSIKMDLATSKSGISKSKWLLDLIREKVESEEDQENPIEQLRHELNELKNLISKT